MKKKYEDMTPEEQRKYLDKMNRQTEGISLAALALSFVSLVILVIKKRLLSYDLIRYTVVLA